ncbi:MAG: hypothetical protein SFU98_09120 [Leptospiraceae bacterium]|nr:hypothetical protein [Leptospiraceae bacterium]
MKLFLLCFLVAFFGIQSDSKQKLTPEQLLSMSDDSAKRAIDKLTKQETDELITQIRVAAKKDYPNSDKFYFLISHLERISAITEEQARLEALNSVYLFGLVSLTSFLGYLLFSQRKLIRSIETLNQ